MSQSSGGRIWSLFQGKIRIGVWIRFGYASSPAFALSDASAERRCTRNRDGNRIGNHIGTRIEFVLLLDESVSPPVTIVSEPYLPNAEYGNPITESYPYPYPNPKPKIILDRALRLN